MSDPADDWNLEYEDEDAGLASWHRCYAAGYWFRSKLQPVEEYLFVQRSRSLNGPWETVHSDTDALSVVFAVNDIVALWIDDPGGNLLRWSDDAFDTYQDVLMPSGWERHEYGYNSMHWDGSHYAVLVQATTGLSSAVATSTDLSEFTVEASSSGTVTVREGINGTPSGGWSFTRVGAVGLLTRVYIVYAKSLAGTWNEALALEIGELASYRALWNGQQAAVIRQNTDPIAVWTSSTPNGTYTLVDNPAPSDFVILFGASFTGKSDSKIQWDEAGQQWVILAQCEGEGDILEARIAVTPDLGTAWEEVAFGPPNQYLVHGLVNYDDEWYAVLDDGRLIFTPGGAGAGWGLVL